MDVRCTRCGTDYEFDDTLISDRGTTVQCTNCGYQFKIYPASGGGAPERWQVRTSAGKELVYTSLRQLQRAITEHKVGPKDLLSRGNHPARPLGAIPELEPFFTSAVGPPHALQSMPRTLHGFAPPRTAPPPGIAPPGTAAAPRPAAGAKPDLSQVGQKTMPSAVAGGVAPPMPPPAVPVITRQPAPDIPTRPSMDLQGFEQQPVPSVVLSSDTEREPAEAKPLSSPQAPGTRTQVLGTAQTDSWERADPAVPEHDPKTIPTVKVSRRASQPSLPAVGTSPSMPDVRPAPRAAMPSSPSGFESPVPVASSPRGAPAPMPPPVSTRERLPSYDEVPALDPGEPARRARSRWIAGVVVLAVAGLLALTVGRQYLQRLSSVKLPEVSARDERAARFLAEGIRLLDRADYDGAQEQIIKAEALADRDPSVLTARARLDTQRADLLWLKLRLLDPTVKPLVQATERELARAAGKARVAVEAAFAVAPEDPAVARARVDALRVAGQEAKAREWIAPIAANSVDPQNAYVLAALDLAEAAPVWSTVIDRLRAAAVSEHETARARGALIYALVRAGRVVEADTELAKLAGPAFTHPLVEELRSFVGRFSTGLDGGVDASATAAPSGSLVPPGPGQSSGGAGVTAAGGDFRTRLTLAAAALRGGDLTRADSLYQSVLTEQPGSTEALSGMADVARRRGDAASAARLYDRVLAANPSYLPALMASADLKWHGGDRAGALAAYRRLLEQAGASSDYGKRASARIAEAEGTPAPKASSEASPATEPAAPSPKPESDTSDLPGVSPP
jgi:tetratricopeptide (TPR) repeat protein/DNA-directed RNA polymerase subunit RPC12/RpoP